MKKIIGCTFILLILFCQCVSGQLSVFQSPIGLSLSGCDATITDPLSGFGSPAAYAELNQSCFSIMGARRFNISELSTAGFMLSLHSQWGTWNIGGQQTGWNYWQSSRYLAGFSRKFGNQILAAFQLNYWNEVQVTGGNFGNITSQVAIIYYPNKQLRIGVNMINPEQSTIDYNEYSMPIPSIMSAGLGWNPIPQGTLFIQMNHNLHDGPDLATAFEGQVFTRLKLRGGYSLTNQQVSVGMGLILSPLQINLGLRSNPPLGWISCIAISWSLSSNKGEQ